MSERPAFREAFGYALLAAVVYTALVRLGEVRDGLRWAVHKAAELVPPPDKNDDDADA